MKISEAVFRFRRWVLLAVILVGFWAPWERMGGAHPGTVWLFLAALLTRAGLLGIGDASVAVMGAAILLALLAALLRTWGTAYLGSGVVQSSALHAERIVADGPYRYLRNPLYAGTWLNAAALAVLMPPGGALFTVIAVAGLNAVKIRAEERHLLDQRGEAYEAYARKVPSFFAAPRARMAAGGERPRWVDGVLGEIYYWGVFVTYVAFAGRYNVTLLEQGVLISLGIAIVVRGASRPRMTAVE